MCPSGANAMMSRLLPPSSKNVCTCGDRSIHDVHTFLEEGGSTLLSTRDTGLTCPNTKPGMSFFPSSILSRANGATCVPKVWLRRG